MQPPDGSRLAHGPELHSKTKPHVIATAGANEGLVGVVKVEVARELVG